MATASVRVSAGQAASHVRSRGQLRAHGAQARDGPGVPATASSDTSPVPARHGSHHTPRTEQGPSRARPGRTMDSGGRPGPWAGRRGVCRLCAVRVRGARGPGEGPWASVHRSLKRSHFGLAAAKSLLKKPDGVKVSRTAAPTSVSDFRVLQGFEMLNMLSLCACFFCFFF